MRQRKSARLLVIDKDRRVLLFRFIHKAGALAGQDYWATPGGGVEDDETFHDAAIRELREETGLIREALGEPLANREFSLQLPDGEYVSSFEQYYLVTSDGVALSRLEWTPQEAEVIADHRWWSRDELRQTTDVVWPENLLDMLAAITK
ncbi:NUDIX domain-containing protein [Tardiphaga sp. P9-11]|uniref:NUDIX hydrolase n=1 Tax=Tardiphaga sp. P9-11 TaxID=2024614 RepID=UPI0011F1DD09|nr:NUDIX domain-containing protein [Tardiphaga sp. P9-11]KAA0077009.1 NUDIX domain-containing protein [Tardiphaga sp. P9-11]